LLTLFPEHSWEMYDIDNKVNQINRDTLLDAPSYKGKWVITNPPYLAKNKAQDKTIFAKYDTDDLYKASLLSILECEGGILIIPTNFFTDERTSNIRSKFLNQFNILEVNIFTEPVFETTTYSICSFAFQKKENNEEKQTFTVNVSNKGTTSITLYPKNGYRLAGEFYDTLSSTNIMFGRLIGSTSNDYITNIKLYALDTRNERIRVEFEPNHY
jgi:hypothetical protein